MILSICIMFYDGDVEYIEECLATLPIWSQVVTMRTIAYSEVLNKELNKKERMELKKNKVLVKNLQATNDNMAKFLDYYYIPPFEFDTARNTLKSYADGDWIMMLDADERLLFTQHNQLYKSLSMAGANIGGIFMHVVSNHINLANNDIESSTSKQIRLFRNKKEFHYISPIHETIDKSIYDNKCETLPSTFKIEHIGYEVDKDRILNKLDRNINGLLARPDITLNYEHYKNILMRDIYNYLTIKKLIK